ncbi:flagellar filament capping protein FliD [Desulfobacter sp. UBA2225]|uniref:flagellar filament capping protein FliD n=1 Tax=Desulfobacter sp. UBA2225 TaxID=1961413 RepID=UPI00257D08A8|nr:flagellar filament capping protein FliD [Desulfobacter sp. UBA2225]
MATGSITSLGIGSGLDLQDIIDQLKGVDESRITAKQKKQTKLQTQVDAYNTVNAKLFSIKSDALNLSLASNFLGNRVSISNEDILSATVGDGYDASSYSLEVSQKAQRNSWASTAAAGKTDALFNEPGSGISDTDTTAVTILGAGVALTDEVTLSADTLVGAGSTIASGSTLSAGTVLTTDIINNSGTTIVAGTTLSVDTVIQGDTLLQEDMTLRSGSILEADSMSPPLSIYYGADGDQKQIDINLDPGMSFEKIIDAINNSADNTDGDGNQMLTASIASNDNGEYYVRLSPTSGGNTEDSQISVSGFDWVAADTTVGITQGDRTMYLTVAPGTTYQGMAKLINDAEDNPGITAAIINNGDTDNPYQLTLIADKAGEKARITLSNFDELTEVNGAGGQSLNAEFTVDGISYSRQSNSRIDDVIDGVTFELKSVGETTLDIEVSHDTVREDLLSMIKGFNDLVSYITGTGADSSNTESETEEDADNPFESSSSARRIVAQLKSLLTKNIDLDSAYTSLIDLGLDIAKDGTISIDEDTLDEAITNDPDALRTLFLGDEDKKITGIADVINDALSEMVSSTGIASTEIDEAEAKIDRLDQDIYNETARLTKKYEIMSAEFRRLDTYINQLNSEAALLTSLFDSFSTSGDD